MWTNPHSPWQRYSLAVLTVIIATLLMLTINPWSAMSRSPFLLFYGAVTVSAWYGGLRTGLVTTVLSALVSTYFFLPPFYGWMLELETGIKLVLFVLVSVLICALCEALHQAKRQAEKAWRSLQEKEEALQQSEERYRVLTNHVPQLIWMTDTEGNVTYFNQRWYNYTGLTPEQSLGWKWEQAIHPEDLSLTLESWKKGLKTGDIVEVHYRLRQANGEYCWYMMRAIPLRKNQGEITSWFGTSTDIHRQKQVEQEQIRLTQALESDLIELQQTQEELRVSEARFRQIFECNMVGMAIWTRSGKILDANKAMLDLIGYTRQELEARLISWRDLTSPEYAELDNNAVSEMKIKGVFTPYEKEYIHKDGRRIPILIGGALLPDEPGRGISFAVDLSERKKVEEALYKSMAILSAVNQTTPSLIYVKDQQGRIIMANPATIRAIGKPEAEIIGYTEQDFLFNIDEAQQIRQTDRRIMESGQLEVVEEIVELPEGKRTFLSTKSPYWDDQGNVIGLIGVSLDITKRMQSEEMLYPNDEKQFRRNMIGLIGVAIDITEKIQSDTILRQSEARFRQFAENINDVLWICEPQAQQFLYVSNAYEQVWGRSCESLYSNFGEWFESIHPEDLERVLSAFYNQIKEGKYNIEYRVVRPDGSIRWVRDRGFFIKDESEEAYRVAGIAEDITERKQAEAILQQKRQELINLNNLLTATTTLLQKRNQELDQFAYIVSHDLKAPLRAINNLSQWMEDDLSQQLSGDSKQQMQLLRDRVFRMENLIDGLLEYSRVGRTQTAIKTVAIESLLIEVIDLLDPPFTFRIEIVSEMPTLETEELPLTQVFINLIGNAVKHHGRSEGRVQVSVQNQGDYYQFTIADNGQGIAPQYHERIFTIFQTANSKNKESTGIGLAIVKKIVETRGGNITVESELGQGTIFRFTWPKVIKNL